MSKPRTGARGWRRVEASLCPEARVDTPCTVHGPGSFQGFPKITIAYPRLEAVGHDLSAPLGRTPKDPLET